MVSSAASGDAPEPGGDHERGRVRPEVDPEILPELEENLRPWIAFRELPRRLLEGVLPGRIERLGTGAQGSDLESVTGLQLYRR
jgi:hypothetical protein